MTCWEPPRPDPIVVGILRYLASDAEDKTLLDIRKHLINNVLVDEISTTATMGILACMAERELVSEPGEGWETEVNYSLAARGRDVVDLLGPPVKTHPTPARCSCSQE